MSDPQNPIPSTPAPPAPVAQVTPQTPAPPVEHVSPTAPATIPPPASSAATASVNAQPAAPSATPAAPSVPAQASAAIAATTPAPTSASAMLSKILTVVSSVVIGLGSAIPGGAIAVGVVDAVESGIRVISQWLATKGSLNADTEAQAQAALVQLLAGLKTIAVPLPTPESIEANSSAK